MLSELPYEVFDLILDFCTDENKANFYKSYNKEIYDKAIKFNKKNILNKFYMPNTFVNSKLFVANNISIVLMEDIKCLENETFKNIKNINLDFCDIFNENIDFLADLDIDIKKINFGLRYDTPVNKFPKFVDDIRLNPKFPINSSILPDSLRSLIISRYNSSTISTFPENLEKICANSNNFPKNSALKKIFPNLIELDLTNAEKFDLENLPEKLKFVRLKFCTIRDEILNLPDSIEMLILDGYIHKLNKYPASLKYLSIDCFLALPDLFKLNIEHLCINNDILKNIKAVPKTITHLSLKISWFSTQSKLVIPENIEHLYLDTIELIDDIEFSSTVKYLHIPEYQYPRHKKIYERIIPSHIQICSYNKKFSKD